MKFIPKQKPAIVTPPVSVYDTGTQTAVTLGIDGAAYQKERLYEAEISGSQETKDWVKPATMIPYADIWTNYKE